MIQKYSVLQTNKLTVQDFMECRINAQSCARGSCYGKMLATQHLITLLYGEKQTQLMFKKYRSNGPGWYEHARTS